MPELTNEAFHARLEGSSEEWLRSGDLAFIFQDNLYICGRMKDLIIIRGRNQYPQDIEALIEEDHRLRPGCTAAFSVDVSYLNSLAASATAAVDDEEVLVVVCELRNEKVLPE